MWAPVLAIFSSKRLQNSVDKTKQGWSVTKHSYEWLLNGAVSLLKAALVIFAVIIVGRVIHAQLASGYLLGPVAVSSKLVTDGYTAVVATALLTEQIERLQEEAVRDADVVALRSARGLRKAQKSAIDIPGMGVKLDEFVALMGQALPFGPRNVSVSLVKSDKQLTATVRIDGRPVKLLQQLTNKNAKDANQWGNGCTRSDVECLIRKATLYISSVTDPVITALKFKNENNLEALSELLRDFRKHERRHDEDYYTTLQTLFAFVELAHAARDDSGKSATENRSRRIDYRAKAQVFFSKALARQPDDALLLRLMAENARKLSGLLTRDSSTDPQKEQRAADYMTEADRYFTSALERSPKNPRLRLRWMYHLANTHRLQQAHEVFTGLQRGVTPNSLDSAQLYQAWADALRDQPRPKTEAHKQQAMLPESVSKDPGHYYQKAVTIDPANPMLFASIGTWNLHQAGAIKLLKADPEREQKKEQRIQLRQAAVASFSDAIRNSESILPSWVYANMAEAYTALKEPAAAIAMYEQSAAAGPLEWARNSWLRALRESDLPLGRRLQSNRQFINYYPDRGDGHGLYLTERTKQLLAEMKGVDESAELAAVVKTMDAELSSSLAAVQAAATEDYLLTAVARTFRRAGFPALSEQYAQRALEYDPYHYSAYIEKALSLIVRDQVEAAERTINVGVGKLKQAPIRKQLKKRDQAGYHFAAGRMLIDKKPKAARTRLRKAMSIDNYSAWMTLHLATALLNLDKADEALQLIETQLPFIQAAEQGNTKVAGDDVGNKQRALWRRQSTRAGAYFRYGLALLSSDICTVPTQQPRMAEAAKAFSKASRLSKDHEYLAYAIAANVLNGNADDVKPLLTRAEERGSKDSKLSDWLELIDSLANRLPTAQEVFAKQLLVRPQRCSAVQ